MASVWIFSWKILAVLTFWIEIRNLSSPADQSATKDATYQEAWERYKESKIKVNRRDDATFESELAEFDASYFVELNDERL